MQTLEEKLEELRAHLSPELQVLMVVISDSWGGLEQVAISDARLLTQQGIHVTMLVREGSPVHKRLHDESPHIPLEFAPAKVRNFLDRPLRKILRNLIKTRGINLIHCHQTSILGSVVPALSGYPHVALVVSRHILNSHNKRDPLHALIYKRVDYVFVISKTMKQNLLATFPLPEKKLRTIRLAIDLERFNPGLADRSTIRREWGIPDNAFVVGCVGRLDPMKGQDTLMKAIARVCTRVPEIYGLMVGNETPGLEGAYIEELQTTINDLHLADRVVVKEAVENVPQVMAALDLFVMPSWSEAFGLVALEAMAMGVPALIARGGSSEEIAAESGAQLFRSRDAYDLASKIAELAGDHAMRNKMRAQGREYVLKYHSRPARIEKTLEFYNRCYRRRIAE